MNIAIDEYGNPFMIVKEQQNKTRLRGLAAQQSNILAARSISDILKTSLGPNGMDKIIVGADGQVTITNDGATILQQIDIEHQCGRLLVDLSRSQDEEVGDGTTGVVILAGVLLEKAYKLLEMGIHPLKVADGFDKGCEVANRRLEEIGVEVEIGREGSRYLREAAMTSLGSKVVSSSKEVLSKMAVECVLSVADLERRDVNFDLIKIHCKAGGRVEDSHIVKGIIIDKELSHSQMSKITKDARIAILTCPFEPPKPKTKHTLDIQTAHDYRLLQQAEQAYFTDMIQYIQQANANFVICQWGFDDEANHLLMQNNIPSIRWVGGVELELIAIATGARIIPRFSEITQHKLGHAALITEQTHGVNQTPSIYIQQCLNHQALTVFLTAGNQIAVAELERSFHDAICCVRNMIRDNRIVPGGGAAEIAASIAVEKAANTVGDVGQYAIRAFSEALLALPEALADNSGMNTIHSVTLAKAKQIEEGVSTYGIDCLNLKVDDMLKRAIHESLISKQHQISLATQVVKMILKIDDVIGPKDLN